MSYQHIYLRRWFISSNIIYQYGGYNRPWLWYWCSDRIQLSQHQKGKPVDGSKIPLHQLGLVVYPTIDHGLYSSFRWWGISSKSMTSYWRSLRMDPLGMSFFLAARRSRFGTEELFVFQDCWISWIYWSSWKFLPPNIWNKKWVVCSDSTTQLPETTRDDEASFKDTSHSFTSLLLGEPRWSFTQLISRSVMEVWQKHLAQKRSP